MTNQRNVALCSKDPPNFLNVDSCGVSYEEDTWVKAYTDLKKTFEDTNLVITFVDETLTAFHNATLASGADGARYLYAVANLR